MKKTHVIFDLYKGDANILGKSELLQNALLEALKEFDVDVEINSFYQFEPYGVTAIVTSPEIHFNIHTWPEYQSCAIDLYCMQGRDFALKVCESIKKRIHAQEHDMKVLNRT